MLAIVTLVLWGFASLSWIQDVIINIPKERGSMTHRLTESKVYADILQWGWSVAKLNYGKTFLWLLSRLLVCWLPHVWLCWTNSTTGEQLLVWHLCETCAMHAQSRWCAPEKPPVPGLETHWDVWRSLWDFLLGWSGWVVEGCREWTQIPFQHEIHHQQSSLPSRES